MNEGFDEDKPHEECGVFGVYGNAEAALMIYRGLFSMQHRGQEGAGMVVSDGKKVRSSKGQGLVNDVFGEKSGAVALPGHIGIGHVRYSTTGSTRIQNVQPLVVECLDGIWAVAHNGNLTNARALRKMYQDAGAIFQTSTDSEALVHLLADPMFRNRPQRVERALSELKGAYSFLIMTDTSIMAARDPGGFRPLSMGRLGGAVIFASETCALPQVGAEFVRDVEPGELVTVDENGIHSSRFAEKQEPLSQCVFEIVYFARPDSHVFGKNVHQVRLEYGRRLAQEHPVEADIVVAIPDSGNSSALGYSQESGIQLDFGFIRNHYIGRTFIMPDAGSRAVSVDMKLAVLPDVVRGKRVVVVDDSIIRGTTAKRRVAILREAGAKEIHMRISCPPTAHPCFYGIDFPSQEELIAGGSTLEETRRFLEADTLGYLSRDGLLSPFKNRTDFCDACFSGNYPVDTSEMMGKQALESYSLETNEDQK